jgi:AcrR family transcriptional regulator
VGKQLAVTRRRILDAAIALFDSEGIRNATVDAISVKAGVTKRTFYYHFRSKDDLMFHALEDCGSAQSRALDFALRDNGDDLEGCVERVFGEVARLVSDIRWKGCAFTRAATELAGLPGHPAVAAARKYRDSIENTFAAKLRGEGYEGAARIAKRLIIILDGAITHGTIHHDPEYAAEAATLALDVLKAEEKRARDADVQPTKMFHIGSDCAGLKRNCMDDVTVCR